MKNWKPKADNSTNFPKILNYPRMGGSKDRPDCTNEPIFRKVRFREPVSIRVTLCSTWVRLSVSLNRYYTMFYFRNGTTRENVQNWYSPVWFYFKIHGVTDLPGWTRFPWCQQFCVGMDPYPEKRTKRLLCYQGDFTQRRRGSFVKYSLMKRLEGLWTPKNSIYFVNFYMTDQKDLNEDFPRSKDFYTEKWEIVVLGSGRLLDF